MSDIGGSYIGGTFNFNLVAEPVDRQWTDSNTVQLIFLETGVRPVLIQPYSHGGAVNLHACSVECFKHQSAVKSIFSGLGLYLSLYVFSVPLSHQCLGLSMSLFIQAELWPPLAFHSFPRWPPGGLTLKGLC